MCRRIDVTSNSRVVVKCSRDEEGAAAAAPRAQFVLAKNYDDPGATVTERGGVARGDGRSERWTDLIHRCLSRINVIITFVSGFRPRMVLSLSLRKSKWQSNRAESQTRIPTASLLGTRNECLDFFTKKRRAHVRIKVCRVYANKLKKEEGKLRVNRKRKPMTLAIRRKIRFSRDGALLIRAT